MPDVFDESGSKRIVDAVRWTEAQRAVGPQGRTILPTAGPPLGADRPVVIVAIPANDEAILQVVGVRPNATDPWDGGHVWDGVPYMASTAHGLRGRHYNRLRWVGQHSDAEPVPDAAQVVWAKQHAGVWYVQQMLRFSFPDTIANVQATGCNLITEPMP